MDKDHSAYFMEPHLQDNDLAGESIPDAAP